MMALLSKGLGFIIGPALVPALLLGLVVSITQHFRERDERIEVAATGECNGAWHLLLAKRQQRVAARELQAAQERLEGERAISMGLNNELETIRGKYAELSALLGNQPAGGDGQRISDGLWNDLQRRYGVGRGSEGAGEGGGSRKGSAKQGR